MKSTLQRQHLGMCRADWAWRTSQVRGTGSERRAAATGCAWIDPLRSPSAPAPTPPFPMSRFFSSFLGIDTHAISSAPQVIAGFCFRGRRAANGTHAERASERKDDADELSGQSIERAAFGKCANCVWQAASWARRNFSFGFFIAGREKVAPVTLLSRSKTTAGWPCVFVCGAGARRKAEVDPGNSPTADVFAFDGFLPHC